MAADREESWPVTESTDLYRDDWVVALRADVVHPPDQPDDTFRRLVLEHPGAVIVLAVDEDDRVVVLSQYRHPAQRRFVELPAGLLDVPGEDPAVAGARELREEVALRAEHWEHLITTWSSPGISAERHVFYLATGLSECDRGDFELHAEEADLRVERIPFDDLVAGVRRGEVQDAPTVVAALAYADRRRRAAE